MADEIKYYLDEHVPPAVANGLRQRQIDVLTTQEAGQLGADDLTQLQLATSQERVMFSQDEDFLALHQQGVLHTGIVYTLRRRRLALLCGV
jgi:predicted nuclease of predicted toxin-antitoxin system